jgi:enoyl-CoA hydratase
MSQMPLSPFLRESAGVVTLTLPAPHGKPPTLDAPVLQHISGWLDLLMGAPGEIRIPLVDGSVSTCRPRVLVVTSDSPKYFCAGANLEVLRILTPETIGAWTRLGHEVLLKLEQLRIPVIAQVRGYALGGGLELALACDLILAAEDAKLGQTESRLGLLTGWGASVRLPERVGHATAKRLFFTGRMIEGREALALGLVDAAVPAASLDATLTGWIGEITAGGAGALTAFKRILSAQQLAARHANREAESARSAEVLRDPDTLARVEAFFATRRSKSPARP